MSKCVGTKQGEKGKEESFEFHFKLEKTFAKVLKLHKAHDKENKVCCFSTTSAHSVDFQRSWNTWNVRLRMPMLSPS
jgi:hypothetical protein